MSPGEAHAVKPNMLRRSWSEHRYFWLGAIGSVVLVLIVVSTFAISESGIGKREYTADFSQAGGIRPGDKVLSLIHI